MFNCRIDSINKKRTWKPLFGKNHAIFPFIQFYEWVAPSGRKQEVVFTPVEREIMWAPAVFDTWQSDDGQIGFSSMAIITDEPPPEIEAAGHDRCPIFLKESRIDEWLKPEGQSHESLLGVLNHREEAGYRCAKAKDC